MFHALEEMTPEARKARLITDLLRGGRQMRPAQIEMALLVDRAARENVPALIEAGTGTGKTGAYLVPLIRQGKKVIISTANKALQDQIYFKDVPFVQQHVQPFGAVRMKGIGNYVCRDRLHEARKDLPLFDAFPELEELIEVVKSDPAFSGDFETLQFSVSAQLRVRVNGDRDACAWTRCDFYTDCYIRKMRETALAAQVVIVNHTLLLLDALTEGAILPHHEDGEIIVIDEAHNLADEATSVFTVSLRATQLSSLLHLHVVKECAPPTLYDEIERLGTLLWAHVEETQFGAASKVPFTQSMPEAVPLVKKLRDMEHALRLNRPKEQTEKETALYDKLLTRVENLANSYQTVFVVKGDGTFVHYLERIATPGLRGPTVQVSAAPLDVAPFLQEKLFDVNPCIIMTSATIATIGPNPGQKGPAGAANFAYFRREVGLEQERYEVLERMLPLTFRYQENALLYIPREVPMPVYGDGQEVQDYNRAVADEMRRLVIASRGRAFLLFSSGRMLDEVYRRIAPTLPFPVLSQREESNRAELIRRFKAEGNCVLFGMKSFWEGVDIAGDALSLVVIDKLPFGPPDDPVHAARVQHMKDVGANWFGAYILPRVVLQLKQGVGRLLRTSEDRGVMAILDTRLLHKGYGRQVIKALPPARLTTRLEDVEAFFSIEEQQP